MSDSFPRLQARTRRFTLGMPRGFTISPDGDRVVFLRSRSGADPVTCLWSLDVASGLEQLIADPRMMDASDENLPPEERARRERSREQAGGIVAYATDKAVTRACFALSGRLYVVDLDTGPAKILKTTAEVIDPRLDPTGAKVAYVSKGSLRVHDVASARDVVLARDEQDEGITYGVAEFIAAEEMHRMRGYWWSPDGDVILAARVDESPVLRWHIADPANPEAAPVAVRYPMAGTANAKVELVILGLDGTRTPVPWEGEYLVTADWSRHGLVIVTQPRDQRTTRILTVDPASGIATTIHEETDPAWVDIIPGVPTYTDSGRLVWVGDRDGGRRLLIGNEPVTPPSLQVRQVLDVDGETVLFQASTEPTEIHVWRYGPAGLMPLTEAPGVYGGRHAGGTTLITTQTLDTEGMSARVLDGPVFPSYAERPGLDIRVELIQAGRSAIRTAVLLPSWHEPGSTRLPVLMDPYGGPGAQRVLKARSGFLTSQWFAEQGFAVIVADGRGTPREPAFEKAILGDLAAPALDDQVEALRETAERYPHDVDIGRVGIRGWSFGGYLAALAVLRRPDVFHAAVAGAPVTDFRWYDTHYTERYLGQDPDAAPYDRSSLIPDAAKLNRPLLLIHGLADDNVVAAHTLRLSSALLAAGRPHSVLPLSGVTHMTSQEVVAENLLLLQVDFLRKALSSTTSSSTTSSSTTSGMTSPGL